MFLVTTICAGLSQDSSEVACYLGPTPHLVDEVEGGHAIHFESGT